MCIVDILDLWCNIWWHFPFFTIILALQIQQTPRKLKHVDNRTKSTLNEWYSIALVLRRSNDHFLKCSRFDKSWTWLYLLKNLLRSYIKIWWNHYCNLFPDLIFEMDQLKPQCFKSLEFCKCCSEGVLVTYLVGIHHILPVLIKAEDGDRYQLALRTIYHSLLLRPLPLTYFAHSAKKCKFIWSIPFVSIVPPARLNRGVWDPNKMELRWWGAVAEARREMLR